MPSASSRTAITGHSNGQAGLTAGVPIYSTRWSPDFRGADDPVTRNGVANLWRQALSSGQPKQLTRTASDWNFPARRPASERELLGRGTNGADPVKLEAVKSPKSSPTEKQKG